MSLLDSLPHKCKIQRRVRAKDALGGNKDSETVEQTGVECWEQQASASEVKDYDKRGVQISRKIYFTSDPALTPRHQILVTERLGEAIANPTVLDVKSYPLPDASAGLGILYKVFADENTGERP